MPGISRQLRFQRRRFGPKRCTPFANKKVLRQHFFSGPGVSLVRFYRLCSLKPEVAAHPHSHSRPAARVGPKPRSVSWPHEPVGLMACSQVALCAPSVAVMSACYGELWLGWAYFPTKVPRALASRGLLQSAYVFLCLIYTKNARASRNMLGQF